MLHSLILSGLHVSVAVIHCLCMLRPDRNSALLFRKISISSTQCRSISFYTNGVRLNEILVLGADFLNPILATKYNVSARDFLQVAMMSIAFSAISTVGRLTIT